MLLLKLLLLLLLLLLLEMLLLMMLKLLLQRDKRHRRGRRQRHRRQNVLSAGVGGRWWDVQLGRGGRRQMQWVRRRGALRAGEVGEQRGQVGRREHRRRGRPRRTLRLRQAHELVA